MADPLAYQRLDLRRRAPVPWWLWLAGLAAMVFLLVLASRLLTRGHPPSPKALCSHNLRQIGLALFLYSGPANIPFPDRLSELLKAPGVGEEFMVCPSAVGETRMCSRKHAAQLLVAGHRSYVYVGAGMTQTAGGDTVVAFELPGNHSLEGGNVMYGDAHVEWLWFPQLVQLVPELEAGHNPPRLRQLQPSQAQAMYEKHWLPQLDALKSGAWAARVRGAVSKD